jgi:DNA modification methylase
MKANNMFAKIIQQDCLIALEPAAFAKTAGDREAALTFFDPPFNQGKDYAHFNDSLPQKEYWHWIEQVCRAVINVTAAGGAFYFMQREKNTEQVLRVLRETGWTLQNLIIWSKRTSAVPSALRYGKQYQIIAFATKGKRPRVFNKLRINPPKLPQHKLERPTGLYVTDCWNDIRELTAGYFAGDEALRDDAGRRLHEQQSPIALLARIILSSSRPGDLVLEPCAGSGPALVVAKQLARPSIGIELDSNHCDLIRARLTRPRKADSIASLREYYCHTAKLDEIWPTG